MEIERSSNKMLPQQPIGGELNVLTMSDEQILNLISATHVPAEENFDDESLLVVVEQILWRANHILGNVLEGDEHLKNVDEKVSRDSFDPILCTLKQLSSEMACKATSVKIAHKTTMSILNKLSSYSWGAKAILALAAFASYYEDFMESPKHVPATLNRLDLKKFKRINELNSRINSTMYIMKDLLKYSKKKVIKDEPALLSNVMGDISMGVYWIIVASTTHIWCLTASNVDKIQELSPLLNTIYDIFDGNLWERISGIEEMYRRRKLKELFSRDAMQPLIDGSTNEMVSIYVLKKKNILLFISSLDISRNNLLDLKSFYDRISRKKGDQYKIIWIPIVEQLTDNLQEKFEMLRSNMPGYIVHYNSVKAGIKFIKKRFNNIEHIVVLMNPQGDVENEYTYPSRRRYRLTSAYRRAPGPYEIEGYTFLCGGKDKKWIEQFSHEVHNVAEDQLIKEANVFIELSCIGKGNKQLDFEGEIQELLRSFKNNKRWAVFMTNCSEVISKDGMTILHVLEGFEKWKVNVRERGFQICFKEYHDQFLQTAPLPSTSRNVCCLNIYLN